MASYIISLWFVVFLATLCKFQQTSEQLRVAVTAVPYIPPSFTVRPYQPRPHPGLMHLDSPSSTRLHILTAYNRGSGNGNGNGMSSKPRLKASPGSDPIQPPSTEAQSAGSGGIYKASPGSDPTRPPMVNEGENSPGAAQKISYTLPDQALMTPLPELIPGSGKSNQTCC